MESSELQKEGVWAPLTPAKSIPERLEFVPSYEGGGSGRDFADNVMSGKFCKENINRLYACSSPSSNSEESLGAKSAEMGSSGLASAMNDCELTLDALKNISFMELLRSPGQFYQQKTSEAKTSSLSPPTNTQASSSITQKTSEAKTSSLSPPTNTQASSSITRNSFEVPPTPPPMNTKAQASPSIPRNSVELPPTPPPMNTQAARQPFNSFQIPASDQDDVEVNKKLRQPQQRRRMKKHRPKVVVDGKLRKPPKTPKTPKPPKTPKAPKTPKPLKTPKTPQAPKTPKRESCKRVLNFNLNEQEQVEEDDRAVIMLKDDLQEEVKNGSKGSGNAEDGVQLADTPDPPKFSLLGDLPDPEFNLDDIRRKLITSKRSVRRRRRYSTKDNFVPSENMLEDVNVDKQSQKIIHYYQRRKSKIIQEPYVCTPIKTAESSKDQLVTNQKGCSDRFLIVYVRKFQPNQCRRNSRKLGPIFPRLFKKPRMRRQRTTAAETLFSILAPKIGERQVRKAQGLHKKTSRRRHSARKINLKGVQKGLQKSLAYDKSGIEGCNYQKTINDAKSFMCVLSWGVKCRRKRSKIFTRRRILSSPTAINFNHDRSLSILCGHDQGNSILPFPVAVNPICDQYSSFHPGQDLGNASPSALNPESDQLSLLEQQGVVSLPPGSDQLSLREQQCVVSLPSESDQLSLPEQQGVVSLPLGSDQLSLPEQQSVVSLPLGNDQLSLPEQQGVVSLPLGRDHLSLPEQQGVVSLPLGNDQLSLPEQQGVVSLPLGSDHLSLPEQQGVVSLPLGNDQLSLPEQQGVVSLPLGSDHLLPPERQGVVSLALGSDQISLPEQQGVVILPPERDQLPLPEQQGVVGLPCDQVSPPSTKSGKKRFKALTRKQNLYSPVQNTVDFAPGQAGSGFVADIEDFPARQHDLWTDEGAGDHFFEKLTEIIQGLEALHIREESMQLVVRDQDEHGALVEFDAPKKRKKSAKVDHDEETLRVWKLLTENEGSNPFENMDKDKEQWWEEQRKIFLGRIGSFIMRMHQIQGDRRFSPWKGSVVDSVVGVYLTQNVSDHLSSSAFMTLAAKFPPKSTSNNSETGEAGVIVCSQESVGSNKVEDGQPCNEKGLQLEMGNHNADIIIDETPAIKSGPAISDAIPGENLEGSFRDGNAAADEPCLREQRHLDAMDHLQNTSNAPLFDLNMPLWDPLGLLGGNSVDDRKKKRKYDTDINDPNAFLGNNGATTAKNMRNHQGRNGVVGGKNAEATPRKKKTKVEEKPEIKIDWDELRKKYSSCRGRESGRNINNRDTVDWEAVRCSTVNEIAKTIKKRGMNNVLARRIKEFLDRIYRDHGSLDLEWLRDVPPEKAKEYLLSIDGLGLKSVECVRLLCLHNIAFPVDTNVARVAVRLGWVPLQPLAEQIPLHHLNAYPLMDDIQKYLWPRLLSLSQKDLYELHYQMITFGKVFCTMKKPNCQACPMRAECKHYASKLASDRFALPKPEKKRTMASNVPVTPDAPSVVATPATKPSLLEFNISDSSYYREGQSYEPIIGANVRVKGQNPPVVVSPAETFSLQEINISDSSDYWGEIVCEPIIEVPPSPGPIDTEALLASDSEDLYDYPDDEDIPTIRLNTEEFTENLRNELVSRKISLQDYDMSGALVALTKEPAPPPRVERKKVVERLRTAHRVYELPDVHPLLAGFERRLPDDISPYLLRTWTSADEAVEPERCSENPFSPSCTSIQVYNPETVWGTILIPCRTATRGAFPLNGTYFQVNEVFADDESSREPIRVPTAWLWNLRERILYCGTSASSIFRGLKTTQIQHCFWRGFICVRGFNIKTRIPQLLARKFHVSTTDAAGLGKKKPKEDE